MKRVCIGIAVFAVLALGVIATAEGPDAKTDALTRGAPIATEIVGPSSLSIQSRINYSRAVLRISGPEGMQLSTAFGADEKVHVDLLKADWMPTRGKKGKRAEKQEKKDRATPPNGRYRYEIHFFAKGAKTQYFSGQFFVENGSAVSRDTVRSRQKVAREDLAKPRRGRTRDGVQSGDDMSKYLYTSYFMYLYPQMGYPNTWLTMGSYDYYSYAMEPVTMVNYAGDLLIGQGSLYGVGYADPFVPQMSISRGYNAGPYVYYNYPAVGVGTATPQNSLEVVGPYYPGVQLSNLYSAQNFVLENWNGNFDIWDRTAGSYPLVIQPGTPYSMTPLFIESTGNVGMGTAAPSASLHVYREDGTAQFSVQEASATEGTRTLFNLENNGVGYIRLTDTSADGSGWTFQAEGPSFRFNKAGTGGAEIYVRDRLDATGGQATLTVDGSVAATNVTFTSSRLVKTGLTAVDSLGVLQKVLELPISEWTFKNELNGRRHIGPMAEEFADTFSLGGSDKNISLIDASGITFAAIQGLYEVVLQKQTTIESLSAENQELNRRLELLEAAVGELIQAD
jgi:hypothetical protein